MKFKEGSYKSSETQCRVLINNIILVVFKPAFLPVAWHDAGLWIENSLLSSFHLSNPRLIRVFEDI